MDWPSLHPLIDAGLLPNFRRLVERGTMTTLASAQPLTRETLMTALACGVYADRHGVLAPVQVRADLGGVEAVGYRAWRARAFWDILQDAGWNTACVNWPATSPANYHPGLRVDDLFATPTGSGFDTWAMPPHSASPPWLAEALAPLRVHPTDDLSDYLKLFAPDARLDDPNCGDRLRSLAAILARAATVQAAATHIAGTARWDLLCVDCELVHHIKLAFLRDAPASVFGGVVRQAHVLQDLMLGRLIELAGDGATVVVVSPNGLAVLPDGRMQIRTRGILAISGPGVTPDAALQGAQLVDVAPTILARYGLQAPSDGHRLEPLAPAGTVLRDAALAQAEEPEQWDPADALLAEGYRDTLSAAQIQAMQGAAEIAMLNLGIALLARGNLPGAARVLEQVRARRPSDMNVLRRLARCRARMGDYAACRLLGQTMLAIDPTQPWGHLLLGTWCVLASDPAAADAYLVSARELGAQDATVLLRLGGLELSRGDPAAAAADFEAVLALDPFSAEAAYALGLARTGQGRLVEAETALRRAILLEHHQPLAHLQLGVLLSNAGRVQEAVPILKTALAQGEGHAEFAAALERAQNELGLQLLAGAAADFGVRDGKKGG